MNLAGLQGPSATIRVTAGMGLTFNGAARATTGDLPSCKVLGHNRGLSRQKRAWMSAACALTAKTYEGMSSALWRLQLLARDEPLPGNGTALHALLPLLQGNIIGIDTVLSPPAKATARAPPLWDPSPAATAAAKLTTLPVRYQANALLLCSACASHAWLGSAAGLSCSLFPN